MQKPRDKAYLVIIRPDHKPKDYLQESYEEMRQLVEAARARVLGAATQNLAHPSPSHFVREGKLEEVKTKAKALGANVLIFNADLTPVQARNIEKFTGIPAVDRTGLILDIFGRRAKSAEGKLQVELARLNYMLPRLGGLGVVFSRLGGGVGTRGPGETELEWDRRKVRLRIQRVKKDLKQVHKHRELIRTGRKKRNFMTAAIVGYTNAGKSTLLNTLTGSQTHVEDKVFATLDPKSQLRVLKDGTRVLFIDTVGFIQDLPHTLVEAFHATLEEVAQADFLIHVLDVFDNSADVHKKAVEKVLEEIGAGSREKILALNKADLLTEEQRRQRAEQWPEGILISASARAGLNELLEAAQKIAAQVKAENANPAVEAPVSDEESAAEA